jgi:tRNA (guanine26-N2/guanine27-N2)-dimethyltransferase
MVYFYFFVLVLYRMGRLVEKTDGNQVNCKFSQGHGPPVPMNCVECKSTFKVCGPIWTGTLHDQTFVSSLLSYISSNTSLFSTHPRMIGMLTNVSQELNVCWYYAFPSLCATLKLTPPKITLIRSAIVHAGYEVSPSHADPNGIKTNAPSSVIWDIFRSYVKQNPESMHHVADSIGERIMEKQTDFVADFTYLRSVDWSGRTTGRKQKTK